jgi:hypothetical protein
MLPACNSRISIRQSVENGQVVLGGANLVFDETQLNSVLGGRAVVERLWVEGKERMRMTPLTVANTPYHYFQTLAEVRSAIETTKTASKMD